MPGNDGLHKTYGENGTVRGQDGREKEGNAGGRCLSEIIVSLGDLFRCREAFIAQGEMRGDLFRCREAFFTQGEVRRMRPAAISEVRKRSSRREKCTGQLSTRTLSRKGRE